MASLSGTGILLAIGFFVFNIIFRTHRYRRFDILVEKTKYLFE
jgi:hypothetical protein